MTVFSAMRNILRYAPRTIGSRCTEFALLIALAALIMPYMARADDYYPEGTFYLSVAVSHNQWGYGTGMTGTEAEQAAVRACEARRQTQIQMAKRDYGPCWTYKTVNDYLYSNCIMVLENKITDKLPVKIFSGDADSAKRCSASFLASVRGRSYRRQGGVAWPQAKATRLCAVEGAIKSYTPNPLLLAREAQYRLPC